jgi:hypothetical protein
MRDRRAGRGYRVEKPAATYLVAQTGQRSPSMHLFCWSLVVNDGKWAMSLPQPEGTMSHPRLRNHSSNQCSQCADAAANRADLARWPGLPKVLT